MYTVIYICIYASQYISKPYIYIYETFPKKAMAKVLVNGYVFLQLVKCLFE